MSLPAPKPDQALYDSILESGFSRFPERRENYERFRNATRSATVNHLPIKLDVENVSRCNFRCTMCQVSEWPKMQRANDMELDEFEALIDQQYGLIEIKLQGMGEPLMNADVYFEMIKYARERDIWVRSTNNGSLLHLKENYKRLIESDICEIQISFDGASKETYEKIRVGGKFEQVSQNCKLLNNYGQDQGKHRTRMWVVVQDTNFAELEDFPKLAAELGFARLTFSLDLTDWGQDQWKDHNKQIDRHREFNQARGLELAALGERHGVEVTFWSIDEKYDSDRPEKLCPWPFERAYISSDMRFVPCCMIANPEVSDFGDARDFNAVWNSEAVVEFRKSHLKGEIPSLCQSCYK
jgi:MoaA/NifB/PqqE/SkfB family radical SAM enzyme